jgi:glycerophosphoryl diester phosphodiesterase
LGSPTSFPVPTLREALLHAGGRIILNLDKGYRHLEQVIPILRETNTAAHVLLKGSATINETRVLHGPCWKEFAYMPVINLAKPGATENLRAWLEEPGIPVVELVFDTWTPAVDSAFARCRERGVKIWVNTLWPNLAGGLSDDMALAAPDAVYGRLLESGVTVFQTDRPALLASYLRARGLRP